MLAKYVEFQNVMAYGAGRSVHGRRHEADILTVQGAFVLIGIIDLGA